MKMPHRQIIPGIILLFFIAAGLAVFSKIKTGTTADIKNQGWLSKVQKDIAEKCYSIAWNEDEKAFQAANPAQNLMFTYFNNGFNVRPQRTNIPFTPYESQKHPSSQLESRQTNNWSVSIKVTGYGKEQIKNNFGGIDFAAQNKTATIEDNDLRINYSNDEKGMRQDFIVKSRPKGNGMLKVGLAIDTKLNTIVSKDGITFSNNSEEKMSYNGLKVTDADGKQLEAWFENIDTHGNEIAIVVNDTYADYPVTIDPISSTPSWLLECNQMGATFGVSVSTAGDVNKDGYSDVIVGALGYGTASNGGAFLYLGSKNGLSTTPAWTFKGPDYANLGNSVATAGDVNGDGYSDVVIGAYYYTNDKEYQGAAYVFYGSPSGLPSTANWMVIGEKGDANYGNSVATAGDVNNDGYDDVIIGSFGYSKPDSSEGKAYLYLGSSSGLSTTAAWTAEGNQVAAFFGCSVASAGDVNKDGYDDVIIGAYMYDNPEVDEGKAFLYYGTSTGLSSKTKWTGEGDQAGAFYGASVASAGDINHDGYSDVIVSAYSYDDAQENISKVFVYYGSSSGLPSTANWTMEGSQPMSQFGCCVASAGDVNRDSYSDIIIGARLYDNGQTDEGGAFIYYGSPTGLVSPVRWSAESNQANAYMGKSVSTSGDVNGDGYSDVIVGAAQYNNGQRGEGVAFVYLGAEDPLPVELTSFKAEAVNNQIHLHWTTATEVSNYGFEIERRKSGTGVKNPDWEKIGFVAGHGNSNSPKEYSFTDNKIAAGKYAYRLKQLDNDGTLTHSYEVEAEVKSVIKNNLLLQNYPNPFNPFTKISYSLQYNSKVKLSIYDMLGKEVAVLVNDETQEAGLHDAIWNADGAKSGVYLYILESNSLDGKNNFKSVQKMIYMK